MASHIEHEMTSCLTEIERLQAKMIDLHAAKKKQEEQKESKTNETEPNMDVMQTWLDIHHFNEEQKKMAAVAEQIYTDYNFRMRGRYESANPLTHE